MSIFKRVQLLQAAATGELEAALTVRRYQHRTAAIAVATARANRLLREAEALERRAARTARRCGYKPEREAAL